MRYNSLLVVVLLLQAKIKHNSRDAKNDKIATAAKMFEGKQSSYKITTLRTCKVTGVSTVGSIFIHKNLTPGTSLQPTLSLSVFFGAATCPLKDVLSA